MVVPRSRSRPTTIPVTERTRRLLESVRGQGESFDDLILDLLEDTAFDERFYSETERRWRSEKRIEGRQVMKVAGSA